MASPFTKIGAASRAGLAACRASLTPFTRLDLFAKSLERDPRWARDEIEEVKINIQWSLLEKKWRDRSW
jgi:hypothetical protein